MQPFLEGIRVLDMTQLLPGPYATTLLADVGAEVIKVERPDGGDPVRDREPRLAGLSYAMLTRNRNKESVAIDLKHEGGREAFLALASSADVVVESFRPGVVDRLGVGYDDVREVNEEIVYCSLTGYGQDGPYADRPGHDLNYVGVAGLLGLTRHEGTPVPPGYPVADFAGGLNVAFAVAAAIAGVRAGHGGEYVDVSMTDTVASFATLYADEYFGEGEAAEAGETHITGGHPGYGVYRTADGEHVTLGALERRFWANLCEAVDLPEFAEYDFWAGAVDPDERERVRGALEDRIAERPLGEWLDVFDEHDVPAGPVNDYGDAVEDPQLRARGMFDGMAVPTEDGVERVGQVDLPLRFRGDRAVPKAPPSGLGEDTADRLAEVGYDRESIEALAEDGAIHLGG